MLQCTPNIVRSNTISLIFIKIFLNFFLKHFYNIFFYKIVAKYTPKRIKMHHFKKISRESMPPNPLPYKWLRHALHGTKRYENRLTFHKLTSTPPPPPRNETLDMPLSQIMLVNFIFIHIININVFFVVVYVS